MICAVITGPTLSDAKRQIEKAKKASLLEFRLDLFENWSFEEIASLMRGFKVILTWKGDKSVYQKLPPLNPDYIDVENEALDALLGHFPREKIIASTHDFESTHFPETLEGVIQKVAVTAKTFSDVIRLLNWCREGKRRIGVSLGERGVFSRLLAPRFSSLWSYAPVEGSSSPGQIPYEEMSRIDENTEFFALIGNPVSQSIGDIYHNKEFQKGKRNAFYVKIPVAKEELAEAFFFLKNTGFKGLSVTMPLKEAIVPYLDQVDAPCGAVNTVGFIDGRSFGINTDGIGALEALKGHTEVKGKKILLLGAGGAARAFAFEAKKEGAHLFIEKSSSTKAHRFANEFDIKTSCCDWDILVNATPQDFCETIRPNTVVFDMRVSPKWTPLLLEAKKLGAQPIFGEEMFFNQAKAQQSFWFNLKI